MKKSLFKILMMTLMVALLVATFSACNLINDIIDNFVDSDVPPSPVAPSVTEVTAVVKSGLSLNEDGGYVAVVGEEIILDTVLNDKAPDIVEYKWFISSGGQTILIDDSKVLEYTFRNCRRKGWYHKERVRCSSLSGKP